MATAKRDDLVIDRTPDVTDSAVSSRERVSGESIRRSENITSTNEAGAIEVWTVPEPLQMTTFD